MNFRTHWIRSLSLLGLLLLLDPAHAQGRGYTPRACGFDLARDGSTGSPADCSVCRGDDRTTTSTGITFSQRYVSCGAGDDDGAGTAKSPFATITRALQEKPAAGTSLAVCFAGRCAPGSGEQFPLVPVSGQEMSTTREDFSYPGAPALLAGWDRNGDGIYPPLGEEALLDGEGTTPWAIENTRPASDLEFAHFSARDFGAAGGGGFMQISRGGRAERIFLHDLELTRINAGLPRVSKTITFNFFGGRDRHDIAIENLLIDGFGGYLVRGSGGSEDSPAGPYRFRNLTARGLGGDGDAITGFKLWDVLDGVEIAESIFDLDAEAWRPCSGNVGGGCEPSPFLHPAQCSTGWRVHHNEIRGFKIGLAVQPDAGERFCRERDLDDIYFANNEVIDEGTPWRWGDAGVFIKHGEVNGIGRVVIRDNLFRTLDGWESCIHSEAGRAQGESRGSIEISGNTCIGGAYRYGAIAVGVPARSLPSVRTARIQIRDNAVRDLGPNDLNLNLGYWPQALVVDGNEWSPGNAFKFPEGSTGSTREFKERLGDSVGVPPAAPVLLDAQPLR